ncbi:MAG: UDP-N-acetylmuramate--L-alanine ligase [Candidatus Blackburnbacteria bacterium RIFCSPHIGHO2_01_FULL_43_15b]|uniref:UDP-N-acetylmuramate--L-alanine ligase n=1 Tax=Candidatus Blackburnbacteria bacterium RIFCSPHIGHO2_01_FULL_43_15b TaxID=1797513 RepID=A0A1G1V1P3_9BACT|nr:MAG: UDP-N-acetylmuramate--L-alanine ligase [Candidatus Blackburnbacteria bacterium RIFCSPHIGHO2_01_FULL_43_15b]
MTSISPLHAKHIHFVGIKGVGMTALALCAKDLGIRVTGSDLEEVFVTDETLKKHGVPWVTGFHPVNIEADVDLVITTGAHGGLNNPEVIAARDKGIPVLTHAEALGEFTRGKDLITVAGVGGKTTTASMVSTLLSVAGRHPSFAVGVGDIKVLGTPGRYDKEGREFVTEADEFAISPGIDNRPRFTYQKPKVLIIPNIEHDHPDIYPTFEDAKRVFLEFINRVPKDGLLIACIDNANVRKLTKQTHVPVQTYGFSEGADYRIEKLEVGGGKLDFEVGSGRYTLKVPGRFNVLNATAAIVAGEFLGVTKSDLVKGVEAYTGCKRRIEKVGEVKGITVWDDYAHHPKELQAVLSALRDWYPQRRLVAVFQPHTYSRTKALFGDFAKAFGKADEVVIMDIYASARETDTLDVDSRKLAEEIKKYHDKVVYTEGQEKTVEYLAKNLQKGDVIVTLGAGDIFHMHKDLLGQI